MNNKKTTKRALLSSVLSLVLCMAMLIGTTFAWFTDSVTSNNNKIQSGTLKIDLELLDKESGKWNSVKESQTPIFNYDKWEPGYTDVKVLRVENEGTLALKWVAKFIAAGQLSELANVIDVYVRPSKETITYPAADDRTLSDYTCVGTVAEFVNSIEETTTGELKAGEEAYLGIALKMRESAGNEYQGMSLGSAFDIQIFATQLASETDSFNNQYDANAPELYTVNGVKHDTAEKALAAAKDGDKVYLSSVKEPITIDKTVNVTIANANIIAGDGVNAITVNADATISVEGYNKVIGGKNADGINVAASVTLNLTGKGELIVKGNGGSESQEEYNAGKGGSGIDVSGTIVVDGLNSLIAEGYGKHAFGIGGATKSITIKNSTIKYAKGGMVQAKIGGNYGKQDNEAGAAIGSYSDGAVINIKDSTIVKAEGGSKAAGIGSMYHTGVSVNIEESNVTAYGGSSSAGIGGSRVEAKKYQSMLGEEIEVVIKNSTVNAVGGDFGAGIGAGYDCYCHPFITVEGAKYQAAPTTTVTIDESSNITAQGGWLGAGIGTGHNVVNFVGNIACDTSKVKAGSSEDPDWCCCGNPCTIAENVGVGAYNIKNFHGENYVEIKNAEDFIALGGNGPTYNQDKTYVLMNDIDFNGAELKPIGSTYGGTLTFLGNGKTLSNFKLVSNNYWNSLDSAGLFFASTDSTLVVKNLKINNVSSSTGDCHTGVIVGYADGNSTVLLQNVDVVDATITSQSNAAVYVGYVAGKSLTMSNCDISGACTVKGEDGKSKTGAYAGTVNTAVLTMTITNCTNGGISPVIGRNYDHLAKVIIDHADVSQTFAKK